MTYNFREDFNNLVVDNAEGFELDWPKHVVHIHVGTIDPEGESEVKILHSTQGGLLHKCLFSEVTLNGAAVSLDDFKAWYREHISFSRAGASALPTETDTLALAAVAALQQQLDETEIIARSDTLQPGEIIPEAGTRFDAAGRRWETLNSDAVVPDPLTVAALEGSVDFDEFTPDSESSSRLFRELGSWDVNGTNTRVHPPELLGNAEVVAIEDANTGANRFISKETDLPTDGPRYLHFRVRIDAANTTSMMIRTARTNFPSELIVDLATGEAFVDNNGAAPFPVIVRKHVTSTFAEYLVRFPRIANATVWQLFPAVGPNGITNRNGFDVASVGKAYFEILDTNAAPESTGNPLYQWFFENYPVLGTDRGCVVPYAGVEGLGVEFVDHGTDNFSVIGENFEINDPTFRVAYSIRKHTNGNSFFVDLRDADNVLNRSSFNPTTGVYNFTGTGGGNATVRDDGDRWFVEIEFNLLQPGPGSLNRIDFVSDWRSGGGSRSSMVLYDFQLFAVEGRDAEIFKQFSRWDLDNGATPVAQGLFGDIPTAILEDAVAGNTAHYALNSRLPLNTEQTIRIKVKRDAAATTSMLLRTTGAGTQELIINLDDGDAHVSNGGAGVDPVVDKSVVTDSTIEIWATFQPNPGITMWDLFPAVGNQNIVGGGGFAASSVGTLEVLELDLNSERPNSEVELSSTLNSAVFGRSTHVNSSVAGDVIEWERSYNLSGTVSIHAPVRARLVSLLRVRIGSSVSIHAPVRARRPKRLR